MVIKCGHFGHAVPVPSDASIGYDELPTRRQSADFRAPRTPVSFLAGRTPVTVQLPDPGNSRALIAPAEGFVGLSTPYPVLL